MKAFVLFFFFTAFPILTWAQSTSTYQSSRIAIYFLSVPVVILATYIIFRELSLRTMRESQHHRISELEQQVKNETDEKNRLIGENKQLSSQVVDSKAKLQSVQEQLSKVQERITKFESVQEEQVREHTRNVRELENSRKALSDEQARIRKEEENKRKQDEAERDRVWAIHEQEVIAVMKNVCQKPAIGFSFYDASNLPEGFDTSLRPDFMVEFLGQYMIFDPKISKSTNLANYVKNQVKSSANKYKKSSSIELIYKTAFFIIPTIELKNIKEYSHFEQGFTFYVIPIEAFEPIISAYRRIADYDLAERFDPQERENIVNLLALLSQHIRHQNATNVLNTILGVRALQECGILPEDVSEAVEKRRKSMRVQGFKPSDVKRLLNSPEEQIRELARIASPSKAPVSVDDLNEAHESILDE